MNVTVNEAREAVYARVLDNYTGVPKTSIALGNEDFKPLENEPWLRVTVQTLVKTQRTLGKLGNRRYRTKALAFIQIFTPTNTGTELGDALAFEAANLFEGFRFSGLSFNAVDTRDTGPDGQWYQHLVEAIFDYDDIK